MPVIEKQPRKPPKQTLSIRVEPDVQYLLERYCEFSASGRQHVVHEALRFTFRNDPEFQAWLKAGRPQ